jgi:hypothetical protein
MVKIHVFEDCGNAPKKLFLRDFIISVVKNDQGFVTGNITDDVQWKLVGDREVSGKPNVLKALQQSRHNKVTELTIHTIVTHGYNGATEGVLHFKDGTRIAFCDVYQFRASTNNAPIKGITTYSIVVS